MIFKHIVKVLMLCSFLLGIQTSSHATSTMDKKGNNYASLQKVVASKHKLKSHIQLLFFQHAKYGVVTKIDKDNCYKITLSGLDKGIIYVSDQPQRVTGNLTIDQFIDTWTHNRKAYGISPNVILHAKAGSISGDMVNDIAVFSQPVYDSKKKTLTYKACPIAKGASFKVKQLNDVNIFIDPFHKWPP